MKRLQILLGAVLAVAATVAPAQSYPRMDKLLGRYDDAVRKMHTELDGMRRDPENVAWVKKQVTYLYERDQYARRFIADGYGEPASDDERRYFLTQMNRRVDTQLAETLAELKTLVEVHEWLKISRFGEKTDNEAWVLVANSERDRAFQARILKILEKLWPAKETSPRNVAFLTDQLAVGEGKPQTFGTQGQCTGPGTWTPHAITQADAVDERRAQMGLEPLQDYVERFREICK